MFHSCTGEIRCEETDVKGAVFHREKALLRADVVKGIRELVGESTRRSSTDGARGTHKDWTDTQVFFPSSLAALLLAIFPVLEKKGHVYSKCCG